MKQSKLNLLLLLCATSGILQSEEALERPLQISQDVGAAIDASVWEILKRGKRIEYNLTYWQSVASSCKKFDKRRARAAQIQVKAWFKEAADLKKVIDTNDFRKTLHVFYNLSENKSKVRDYITCLERLKVISRPGICKRFISIFIRPNGDLYRDDLSLVRIGLTSCAATAAAATGVAAVLAYKFALPKAKELFSKGKENLNDLRNDYRDVKNKLNNPGSSDQSENLSH